MPSSRIIVAMSPRRVIGKDNKIPWHYPGDLRRFKELTTGTIVIMGRKTWESIPSRFRPLPNRLNVVVTSKAVPPEFPDLEFLDYWSTGDKSDVVYYPNVIDAVGACLGVVWFIGGAQIYEATLPFVKEIDVTYVPDDIDPEGAILFPEIDEQEFEPGPLIDHEYEPTLKRRVYKRRVQP